MRITRTRIASALIAGAMLVACGGGSKGYRYNRKAAQASLEKLETPGLVIGEFVLGGKRVLDGDTISVKGLDSTLRLLAMDTEETFKKKQDRRDSDAGFRQYLESRKKLTSRPVKIATPMGEEAKKFAKKFFEGVTTVRLERDHPKEIRGRFNRYLAYVFVEKNGAWVNYNVEAVRAGMSPYFTKYGYSRRFHEDFVAAENEARQAKRGIWAPNCECYDDYPVRKAWWDARADFILEFERNAAGKESHVVLTNWDSMRTLSNRMGQEVTVLALVGDAKFGDRGPSRATLSRKQFNDLTAVFFDRDVFASSGILGHKGEFVVVSGVVGSYRQRLQLVVNLPSQVQLSDVPRFGKHKQPEATAEGSTPAAPAAPTSPDPTPASQTPTAQHASP